ncbi:N-acyl-D-amino-acid deacylase family protein [Rhizohabitans arisaemae]|uniref:N-acyl-D-amino-acid deacylase family protein n=1 Tax=Rhizohabitans arisaemae TaxID=2720610 RepID=UPI0024B22958|nr:amidohydrolase family protein [Rhizohabitans arisaemae]
MGAVLDVIFRGGEVLDGTGAPPYRADVGVRDGRIEAVGGLSGATAAMEVDAVGRYVAPGFVDCHVHGDALVLDPHVQLAALRQGITTFVLGQDGLSYAPASAPATLDYVTRYFAPVNGSLPGVGDGLSVAELLARYDRKVPLNTAYLLPHGTIRYDVMGPAESAADPDALAMMRRIVEKGLAEGAIGLSTGLEYAPGRFADAAEIAALCAPVAAAGLPYVTHMRGYEADAHIGMAEVVEILRRSGAAGHVSHYHGPAEHLLGLVRDAHAQDLDLTFDSYPYLRGSTILGMLTLPPWLPLASLDLVVEQLGDPGVRLRLERDWWPGLAEVWPRIRLSHVPGPLRWAEGLTLPEAAVRAGVSPAEFCRELLVSSGLAAGCVFGQPPTGTEESVRALLRHPAHTAGSDGIYLGSHPHPRGYGAFARFLARYVRELGDWTWQQAAVHLAGRPAARFRLADRGTVERGKVADLIVIDPVTVADRATYDEPRELAVGIDHVLVGGVPVLAGGALTGAVPGRALRPAD